MTRSDFYMIRKFTSKEVQRTGARIKDVQVETIYRLDLFRAVIGRPMTLAHNGLTTGKHGSRWHPSGLAVDWYFSKPNGLSVNTILAHGIMQGFKGIGFYYAEWSKRYSFHFDLRKKYGFWTGIKTRRRDPWTYGPLVLDPKTLLNGG